ncbi:DUF1015 domain-containing protein [bacterium]|nr:DUF1015 domain-containing protein [bacterium]
MAKIIPFCGLRYEKKHVSEIQRLVTPPYDIISPHDQNRFYRAHAYNIIRLEYGKTKQTDSDNNNRYTRAHATLRDWIDRGVLEKEAKPAFYIIQNDYIDPDGNLKKFTGLIGYIKLEKFGEGKILPHEKTYAGPKEDRFNLLKETGVSFSPVFSLYRDPSKRISGILKKVTQKKAALDFKDWAGDGQKLWTVTQSSQIQLIQNAFQGKKLLIADGHHRYLTAIRYQKEMGSQAAPNAEYIMMCLSEIHDPGLCVLPVFRLVSDVPAARWKTFEKKMGDYFEVEKVGAVSKLQAAQADLAKKTRSAVIGYLEKGGKQAMLLKIRQSFMDEFFQSQDTRHSRIYHRLDIVILNQMILGHLLNIQPGEEKGRVQYTKNLDEARRSVSRGNAQAAFLPGLPNIDAIWDLAKQGETLPQKTTYFLPKLITGMVMNPVRLD